MSIHFPIPWFFGIYDDWSSIYLKYRIIFRPSIIIAVLLLLSCYYLSVPLIRWEKRYVDITTSSPRHPCPVDISVLDQQTSSHLFVFPVTDLALTLRCLPSWHCTGSCMSKHADAFTDFTSTNHRFCTVNPIQQITVQIWHSYHRGLVRIVRWFNSFIFVFQALWGKGVEFPSTLKKKQHT